MSLSHDRFCICVCDVIASYDRCYKVLMGFMSLLKKKKKGSTDSDKAKDS